MSPDPREPGQCTLGAMGISRRPPRRLRGRGDRRGRGRLPPLAGRRPTAADAGGEPTGAPSVSDAAREPLDAGVETPPDASTDADHRPRHERRRATSGDAPTRGRARGRSRTPATHPRTSTDGADAIAAVDRVGRRRSRERRRAVRPHARRRSPTSAPKTSPAARSGFNCAPFACDVARAFARSICASERRLRRRTRCAIRRLCGFRGDVACSSDAECPSGHCAQGVCCATACAGPCRSCALVEFRRNLHGRARAAAWTRTAPAAPGQRCNGRGGCVRATCVADSDCGDLYLVHRRALRPVQRHLRPGPDCPAVCVMRNAAASAPAATRPR